MSEPIKILDAMSGDSSEFKSQDGLMTYKLSITNAPNANVKAFYSEGQKGLNGFMLKLSCSDWGDAVISLNAKTDHEDDDFSETRDYFTENELKIFYYT